MNSARSARKQVLWFGLASALAILPLAHAQSPSAKLLTAAPITPTAAWSYYDSILQGDTDTAAAWTARPAEIQEIARALGAGRLSSPNYADNYAQAVLQYVRNNIQTEFRFGLSKGARGALIDQSGTAFDQAHLMAELLRAGEVPTAYKVGSITLNGTQFHEWTGIASAAVACRVLADGGIPANVNGSSSCTGLSGDVSSVEMGHAWIEANQESYDPAYKKHIIKTGVDIANVLGCGTSGAATCGTTIENLVPAPVGGGASLTYIEGSSAIQQAVSNQLKSYGLALEAWIKSQNLANRTELQVDDIIGGKVIDIDAPLADTLPYPSSVRYTWTGDIPDAFRTKLRIQLDALDQTVFADEIAGGRVRIWGGLGASPATGDTATRTLGLYLEYRPLQKSTVTAGRNAMLTLTVDHPYSANGGAYGDEALAQGIEGFMRSECDIGGSCQPGASGEWLLGTLTIVNGWGEAAQSTVSHFGAVQKRDQTNVTPEDPSNPNHVWIYKYDYEEFGVYCHEPNKPPSSIAGYSPSTPNVPTTSVVDPGCFEHQQAVVASSWLAQSSRIRHLLAGMANGGMLHHHSLGWILSGPPTHGLTYASIESSVSATAGDASAARSAAMFRAASAAMSRLEGGVFEQTFDAWEGGSSISFITRSIALGQRIYEITSANQVSSLNQLGNYSDAKKALIASLATAGYSVIAPQNGHLDLSPYQTGGTWLYYNYNGLAAYNSSGDRIAYLMRDMDKGVGGAGATQAGASDPGQLALESTKQLDHSVKQSKYYGVDLPSGALTLKPPPDLVTGVGGFPYSLAFQRYYNSADTLDVPVTCNDNEVFCGYYGGPLSDFKPAKLGGGWSHNLSISLVAGSDGFAGLGRDSALHAAGALAALYTLQELNTASSFRSNVSSILATEWLVAFLNRNTVIVERPPNRSVFVRQLDGTTFTAQPGSTEVLTQQGGRILAGWTAPGASVVWDYRSLSYTLTGGDGAVLSFELGTIPQNGTPVLGQNLFVPSAWQFPDGMNVSFTYEPYNVSTSSGNHVVTNYKCLRSVSNSLGRSLTFSCEGNLYLGYQLYPRFELKMNWVEDENNRRVTFRTDNNEFNDAFYKRPSRFIVRTPDGKDTRYDYIARSNSPINRYSGVIYRWYTPTDTVAPFKAVDYDSFYRVMAVRDNLTPQNVTAYFITGLFGDENQKRSEAIDPTGSLTTSYFNRSNSPLQIIDGLGRVTTNQYDAARRLSSTTYPEGNAEEHAYDARHNLIETTQKAKPGSNLNDLVTQAQYPPSCDASNRAYCNKPSWTQDAKQNRIDYTYLTTGQIESATAPAVLVDNTGTPVRPVTTYGYTANYHGTGVSFLTSKTATVKPGQNRVTSYVYDPSSKFTLWTVTVAPGVLDFVTTFTFDGKGDVRTVNGPRPGAQDTTTYTFDDMRRLQRVEAPHSATTEYEYYDDGLLWRTRRLELIGSSQFWRTEERAYWPDGLLQTVTDPEGNVTQYAYDPAGRVQIVTDPDGRKVKTDYDAAGQTVRSWKAWGSTTMDPIRYVEYTYTPNGKQATIRDANDNITVYQYDGIDRLAYTFFPEADAGSHCQLTSPGAPPTCTGQQTYEQYTYDNNGNRETFRNRKGEIFAYTYDALNRTVTKTAPGLPVVSYGYNLLSEPTLVTNPTSGSYAAHMITYDYDAAGRKAYEESDGRRVSYGYDEASNRTRTIWPNNDYSVTYEYDALNRMSKVWEGTIDPGELPLADYAYDTLSRRTSLTYGGLAANRVQYIYELDNNLDLLTHTMGSASLEIDYERNGSGQITVQIVSDSAYLGQPTAPRHLGNTINKLNQYVVSGPVTGTNGSGDPIIQGASGKFTIIPIDDLPIVIPAAPGTPGKTRPDASADPGGNTVVYDKNGNLRRWTGPNGSRHLYTYDSENRLRSAAVNGGATATITYDYDPLGRRVSKTVNGATTRYLLDGDEEIAEYFVEANGAWTLQRRYVTGPAIDDRVAMVGADGSKQYYHVNHQGSVLAVTNDGGGVVQQLAYDEYGNLAGGSTTGQVFRYTGRRFDEETGLYYYRARYYSPELGRFLQTDPIGYRDDFNIYAYVKNDPLNKNDPGGREAGATYAALHRAESKHGMRTSGKKLTESEAEMIVDAMPFFGDIKGYIDAFNDPSVLNIVAATVGLIPMGGDGAKQIVKKLGDLKPIHSAETIGERTDISQLSDSELLQSVTNPRDGDLVTVNTKTGRVVDGNTRVSELQRRAADPASTISNDTEIPVQTYTPDDSMFPDLD